MLSYFNGSNSTKMFLQECCTKHKNVKKSLFVFFFLSDNDDECSGEGLCSQQRDLDNIDVCITDLDPCGGVKGATGTMCVVMTAVGVDYQANVECNLQVFVSPPRAFPTKL